MWLEDETKKKFAAGEKGKGRRIVAPLDACLLLFRPECWYEIVFHVDRGFKIPGDHILVIGYCYAIFSYEFKY